MKDNACGCLHTHVSLPIHTSHKVYYLSIISCSHLVRYKAEGLAVKPVTAEPCVYCLFYLSRFSSSCPAPSWPILAAILYSAVPSVASRTPFTGCASSVLLVLVSEAWRSSSPTRMPTVVRTSLQATACLVSSLSLSQSVLQWVSYS